MKFYFLAKMIDVEMHFHKNVMMLVSVFGLAHTDSYSGCARDGLLKCHF